jgi:hypothetical protein
MIAKTNHTTLFTIWCIALLTVLPITAALIEFRIDQVPPNATNYWKWFIFWGLGIRLFFKGIRLASTPQSHLTLLELGFANMALGAMGILSLINDQWRLIAAIAGAIYFGLTDMLRLLKKTNSRHERVALVYNILVFLGLVAFMVSQ